MRYLRMLSNSVIAAGVASGYLTALVLQLNPPIPIDPATLVPLAIVLGVAYGANLTVAVLRADRAAADPCGRSAVAGLAQRAPVVVALHALPPAAGAALMWLNLLGFGDVLDREHARSHVCRRRRWSPRRRSCFSCLGLAHLGRRGGRVSAAILSITMRAVGRGRRSIARGPAREPPLPARAAMRRRSASRRQSIGTSRC